MLLLKTEAAESKEESADDITAAAVHPIPTMEMKGGVRCCRTMGRARAASPRSYGEGEPQVVWFQSEVREGREEQKTICVFSTHLYYYTQAIVDVMEAKAASC